MKPRAGLTIFAALCWLACPLSAKGGGHGGGGHSGGGHASSGGGHATGGHASSGGRASSGGHTSGGHASGRTPATGTSGHTAVPRTSGTPSPRSGSDSRPFPSFGFGLGYGSFYSPFWSLYGSSYSGYGYGFTPYPFDEFDDAGGLRLQIEPKDAAVYVDGYYAGIVDDFDGHFQHVNLTPGAHHLEIVAPDYEPLAFDAAIEAHHKTTYRGRLTPHPTE